MTATHIWPKDQHELYRMLGCLNSLMARVVQHAGQPAAAEEFALAGTAYATAADSGQLLARLRLDLATIAYWSGSMYRCLEQAEAGLEHVADVPAAAQLHLIRARAAAELGDASVVRSAICHADQARDRSAAVVDDLMQVVDQISFTPAAHHYYTGAALALTKDRQQEAATELERAIELYSVAPGRGGYRDLDEMAARIDLAVVRLRAGDLEAAQVAVGPVLALPPGLRVFNIRRSLTRARAELAAMRYRSHQDARDLDVQIEQFCSRTFMPEPRIR